MGQGAVDGVAVRAVDAMADAVHESMHGSRIFARVLMATKWCPTSMASMVVGRVQDLVEQETVCERLQMALSVCLNPTATHAHAVKVSVQWQHMVSVKWHGECKMMRLVQCPGPT